MLRIVAAALLFVLGGSVISSSGAEKQDPPARVDCDWCKRSIPVNEYERWHAGSVTCAHNNDHKIGQCVKDRKHCSACYLSLCKECSRDNCRRYPPKKD